MANRKRRRFRKWAAILAAIALAASALGGCAQAASSSSSPANADASGSTAAEGSYTVQVQAVDGDTVMAVVGELTQRGGGTPPNLPSGGNSAPAGDMSSPDGTPPDGQAVPPDLPADTSVPEGAGDHPPDMPSGGAPGGSQFTAGDETITFTLTDATAISVEFLQGSSKGDSSSIVVGAVLDVTLDASGNAIAITVKNLAAGGGFGGSDTVTNGTAATTITEDGTYSGEIYISTGNDENALRVQGATVTLEDITVQKTGGESSNTENGDFYGQNAGLLALDSADVTITGATVETSAVNGNGVFSYGEGTTVTISDSTIRTTERNSGGIQTTGGGTMNATNLTVETGGVSAAAIRSDRGGGTVNVQGGSYTTNGTGSPAIYCTADISVTGATLTATASEGVVVEGKNSVELTDCTLTGAMAGTYGDDDGENIHNIMIYQSMSGDADVGHATFAATGGSITAKNGDMFYVTNTSCTITLTSVQLALANENLLTVAGNDANRGWGTAGANGGAVEFTADAQQMEGAITVDAISTLALTMQNGSTFSGSINADGQAGDVAVTLDAASTWTLTADSYVTSFTGNAASVNLNGHTLYVNGVALA